MTLLEQHAKEHLDKIRFPTSQGKNYILERGKYTKMAYGRLQNNWQNAEDAVQEAYLSLLEYPVDVKSYSNFEYLFVAVLYGVIGRMYRNEKAQERHSVPAAGKYLQYLEVEPDGSKEKPVSIGDGNADPALAKIAEEMLERVKSEIDKLKFNSRNILTLSVLYGYKPQNISNITGLKIKKVYWTIKNFRRKMEDRFE